VVCVSEVTAFLKSDGNFIHMSPLPSDSTFSVINEELSINLPDSERDTAGGQAPHSRRHGKQSNNESSARRESSRDITMNLNPRNTVSKGTQGSLSCLLPDLQSMFSLQLVNQYGSRVREMSRYVRNYVPRTVIKRLETSAAGEMEFRDMDEVRVISTVFVNFYSLAASPKSAVEAEAHALNTQSLFAHCLEVSEANTASEP